MSKSLSEIIGDWGGFEDLIKAMHQTGSVDARRNVVLTGRSGAPRQIDVLIVHREGLYEHKIVAECKHWNKSVSRLHVDALATTIREVGAAKGVIFSVKGFQKGALTQAEHESISLFKVRELTPEEWGSPGRHIDFWMHIIGVSFGNLKFEQPITFQGYEPKRPNVELHFDRENRSWTPINLQTPAERTLEDLIENSVKLAAQQMYRPIVYKNPLTGQVENVEMRMKTMAEIGSRTGIVTLHAGGVVVFNSIFCEVVIDVLQSRFQFDRASNSIFVFAVEDCISRCVHGVQRLAGEELTHISILQVAPDKNAEEALKNGSIFSIWMSGYQDFRKYDLLQLGQGQIVAHTAP